MGFYVFSVLLIFLIYGFFYYHEDQYKYKQPLKELFFFIAVSLIIVYKVNINTNSFMVLNIFILLSIVFIFILYKMPNFLTPPKKIVAKQSNFWNVNPKDIIKATERKIVEKKNRKEYIVNPLEKLRNNNFSELEIKKKKLSQNFIVLHLKEYDNFTIKKDIDILSYMKSPDKKIFKIIFEKIDEFIDNKEADVDYQEVFENNKFCVEFFLMELWEEHSLPFSYGIGTLQLYLYDKEGNIDEDAEAFLYALDATRTTTINRKGFSLYYYYHFFKNKERNEEKGELL